MFLFIETTDLCAAKILMNSNTSHVFIYHWYPYWSPNGSQIQIHPMFLFIDISDWNWKIKDTFKYIPCFYLSEVQVTLSPLTEKFKYIPCFYLSRAKDAKSGMDSVFKYIPCFYLSFQRLWLFNRFTKFKYIPCFYLSGAVFLYNSYI